MNTFIIIVLSSLSKAKKTSNMKSAHISHTLPHTLTLRTLHKTPIPRTPTQPHSYILHAIHKNPTHK